MANNIVDEPYKTHNRSLPEILGNGAWKFAAGLLGFAVTGLWKIPDLLAHKEIALTLSIAIKYAIGSSIGMGIFAYFISLLGWDPDAFKDNRIGAIISRLIIMICSTAGAFLAVECFLMLLGQANALIGDIQRL